MVCATRYVDARFTWPAGEGLRHAVDGERVIPSLSISPRRYQECDLRHHTYNVLPATYYNLGKGEQGCVSVRDDL